MHKLTLKPLNALFVILSYIELVIIIEHDSIISNLKYPDLYKMLLEANKTIGMNIISSIILIAFIGYISYNVITEFQTFKKKKGLVSKFVFLIMSFALLISYSDLEFPNIWNNISYIWYGYFLVAWLIGREFLRLSHKEKTKKVEDFPFDKELSGFSIKTYENQLKDYGGDKYAAIIVNKLLNTKTDESYALGISGSWGCGKTQFLSYIKKYFEGRASVIEFNPWLASSSSMIILNFFKQLSQCFDNIKIKNQIVEYTNLLIDAGINSTLSSVVKIVKSYICSNDTDDVRELISKAISNNSKPFVVIIDDIDRLECDEILEVLRLIRNTANFKNMYYIVAYDKEYVIKSLKGCKIENEEKYLDKIFNVEVKLPLPCQEYLTEQFIEEFDKQSIGMGWFDANSIKRILSTVNISDCLKSFRDIKRFVNLLCSDMEYIALDEYMKEIDIRYYVMLELLYYSDNNAYNTLANNPQKLLGISEKSDNKLAYIYDENKLSDMNKFSKTLLERLFYKKESYSSKSIQLLSNFDRYFFLHNNPYGISQNEFNILLCSNKNSDIKEIIKSWVSSEKIRPYNITTRFVNVQWYEMSNLKWKNYICALFEWCKMVEFKDIEEYISPIFQDVFLVENLKNTNAEIITKYINEGIDALVKDKEYVRAEIILISIMSYLVLNEKVIPGNLKPDFVWTMEKPGFARNKICDVFNDYLNNESPEIYDLCNENSSIYNVLYYSVGNPTECEEVQHTMVFDELKSYFMQTKNTNDFGMFSSLLLQNVKSKPRSVNAKRELGDYLLSIFGNIDLFYDFICNCFDSKKDIDSFLESNMFAY